MLRSIFVLCQDPILRHVPPGYVSCYLSRVSSVEENRRALAMIQERAIKRSQQREQAAEKKINQGEEENEDDREDEAVELENPPISSSSVDADFADSSDSDDGADRAPRKRKQAHADELNQEEEEDEDDGENEYVFPSEMHPSQAAAEELAQSRAARFNSTAAARHSSSSASSSFNFNREDSGGMQDGEYCDISVADEEAERSTEAEPLDPLVDSVDDEPIRPPVKKKLKKWYDEEEEVEEKEKEKEEQILIRPPSLDRAVCESKSVAESSPDSHPATMEDDDADNEEETLVEKPSMIHFNKQHTVPSPSLNRFSQSLQLATATRLSSPSSSAPAHSTPTANSQGRQQRVQLPMPFEEEEEEV